MLELAALTLVAAISTTFVLDIARPTLKLISRRRTPKTIHVAQADASH